MASEAARDVIRAQTTDEAGLSEHGHLKTKSDTKDG